MVAENQPGHIDQIKQTNAGAVYRLIDQLGPVSRIDLSRLAQLAPASITKIVREMLEAHLVQELEIKEAGNRGRPAVGLVVETEAWHYLSLRISRGEIFLALRDLSSKLVVEESQELALKDDLPLLDRIISHIDQFFIRHQKKLERLTSIAITLPGIIDTENGIVHRMPFYEDVKEMPLGEALEQHGHEVQYFGMEHMDDGRGLVWCLTRGARCDSGGYRSQRGGGRHYRWSSATRRQQ